MFVIKYGVSLRKYVCVSVVGVVVDCSCCVGGVLRVRDYSPGERSCLSAPLLTQPLLRGRAGARRDQPSLGARAVIGPFPRGLALVGAASPRAPGELRPRALCDSTPVSRVLRG